MDSIPDAFRVQFDQIIGSLHNELDVRAGQLFQLFVSELNKPTAELVSGATDWSQLYTGIASRSTTDIPQQSIPELGSTISQQVGNLVFKPRVVFGQNSSTVSQAAQDNSAYEQNSHGDNASANLDQQSDHVDPQSGAPELKEEPIEIDEELNVEELCSCKQEETDDENEGLGGNPINPDGSSLGNDLPQAQTNGEQQQRSQQPSQPDNPAVEPTVHQSNDSDEEHDEEDCHCAICIKEEDTNTEVSIINDETGPNQTSGHNGSSLANDSPDQSASQQGLDDASIGSEQHQGNIKENSLEISSVRRSTRNNKRKINYHEEPELNVSDQAGPSTAHNQREPNDSSQDVGSRVTHAKKRICQNNVAAGMEEKEESFSKFIIRSLTCLADDCDSTFTSISLLNEHMGNDHGIHQYRCLLPRCGRSFNQPIKLKSHLLSDHPLAEWKCCGREQKNHKSLNQHMLTYHYQGRFACRVEQCHFEASTRIAVINHYTKTHYDFVCSFDGCRKTFGTRNHLILHESTHRDAKPFLCKWPGCGHSCNQKVNMIRHIRTVHFNLPKFKKEQLKRGIVDNRDPEEFIEKVNA